MEPISIALGLAKLTGLDKKIGSWIDGDNGEAVASKVVDIASTITGKSSPEEVINSLSQNEQLQTQFRQAVLNKELELERLAFQNTENARDMQKAALGQEDKTAKHFVYMFAWYWGVVSSLYIGAITFVDIPDDSVRFADTILGFLLGTTLGAILNFFYGSSQGSKDKNRLIK